MAKITLEEQIANQEAELASAEEMVAEMKETISAIKKSLKKLYALQAQVNEALGIESESDGEQLTIPL